MKIHGKPLDNIPKIIYNEPIEILHKLGDINDK